MPVHHMQVIRPVERTCCCADNDEIKASSGHTEDCDVEFHAKFIATVNATKRAFHSGSETLL